MMRGGAGHWSRWLVRAQWLLLALIFCAALALRLELVAFGAVFQVFRVAGLAMLGMALLGMAVFIWGLVKRHAGARSAALWAAVLGLVPVAVPLLTVGQANLDAPPISDISTDLDNPPPYRAALSLREKGDNSAEYAGEAVARQQRGTRMYNDIRPLLLAMPVERATGLAAEVARGLSWRIVALDPGAGHLEAVDRTPLLRLRDDVVVRVRSEGDGARVDVRSSSRVGRGDLGANAGRIREFLRELEARAAE
ncbi:DUF1499 domain-containing protein [Microbulbifer halophilus]|uniref:DUF1499 domain-containing protein n=1 Tax=Microbulbifer halophilus TaxID=453963 RepID=A0ABW5EEF2_9GAMM|nr:DUF1499 domain-containing protein [Microbulbifer halophilus]MCW8127543.1 DUF1499 domain-containing protein [Microbulbifer halophilus]